MVDPDNPMWVIVVRLINIETNRIQPTGRLELNINPSFFIVRQFSKIECNSVAIDHDGCIIVSCRNKSRN